MEKLEVDIEAMRAVLNQPQRTDSEFNISSDILDGKADEDSLRSVWGNWYGRQQAFYQRCTHLSEGLAWCDVEEIGGAEVQVRAQIVKAAHHKLITNYAPTHLSTGSYQVVNILEDYVRVTSYSPYDPLDIPKQVMEALPYFNGRPLNEALDIITRQKNIPLNSVILQTLLDFGVLVKENEGS
jgi:hypothetical protein